MTQENEALNQEPNQPDQSTEAPDERRVQERAAEYAHDKGEQPDDPERAARALLKESDERTHADRAPREPGAGDVVRRTSEEATPPTDV